MRIRETRLTSSEWTVANTIRSCPLCDSSDTLIVSESMQYHLDLKTVICRKCGLVYTNPVPSEDLYNLFYKQAYAEYYGGITGEIPVTKWQKEPYHIQTIMNAIEQVQPLHSQRLIEIGPGKGQFLFWAKQRGAKVLGVEPSEYFHSVLQKNGLPSINGTLEELHSLELGTFDYITMFHVLTLL